MRKNLTAFHHARIPDGTPRERVPTAQSSSKLRFPLANQGKGWSDTHLVNLGSCGPHSEQARRTQIIQIS